MSTPERCDCLVAWLASQGYRELAAAHLFAAGVKLAPTLDDKQMLARHSLEELEHFERLSVAFDELGGDNLLHLVAERLDRLPTPTSWPQMVTVGVLFDRAVYYQLRAYATAPDPWIAALAVEIIADEQEHLAAGQAALRDLVKHQRAAAAGLIEHVDRWLPLSLDCFDAGGIDSPGCPRAPHGSPQASGEARRAYLDDVAEVLVPHGIPATRFSFAAPGTG